MRVATKLVCKHKFVLLSQYGCTAAGSRPGCITHSHCGAASISCAVAALLPCGLSIRARYHAFPPPPAPAASPRPPPTRGVWCSCLFLACWFVWASICVFARPPSPPRPTLRRRRRPSLRRSRVGAVLRLFRAVFVSGRVGVLSWFRAVFVSARVVVSGCLWVVFAGCVCLGCSFRAVFMFPRACFWAACVCLAPPFHPPPPARAASPFPPPLRTPVCLFGRLFGCLPVCLPARLAPLRTTCEGSCAKCVVHVQRLLPKRKLLSCASGGSGRTSRQTACGTPGGHAVFLGRMRPQSSLCKARCTVRV